MSVFQHPHLTRGIVKTAKGSFIVKRGLVEAPDEIGEELGWLPVDTDDDYQREFRELRARDYDEAVAKTAKDKDKVEKAARDAEDALDSEEAAELEKAEAEGRSHAKE